MKRIIPCMVVSMVAIHIHAQQLGLPVATDASPAVPGTWMGSGGLVLESDVNVYGGRVTFNSDENLSIFGGMGLIDIDNLDMGFGLQGGVLYRFPGVPDLPFDFGVRGTLSYGAVSDDIDIDIVALTAMGLASYTIDEMFSLYGVLGLAHARTSVSFPGMGSISDSETEPALGVGVLMTFTPELSAYVEIMNIDETFFAVGARYKF